MADRKKSFGELLKEARKKRGISQEKLAEIVGVTRQTIIRMESGAADVPKRRLDRLLEALDTTLEEILGDTVVEGRVPVKYYASGETWRPPLEAHETYQIEVPTKRGLHGPQSFAVYVSGPGMSEELPVGSHAICEPADAASDLGTLYLVQETKNGDDGKPLYRWTFQFLVMDESQLWLLPPDPSPRFQPSRLSGAFKVLGRVTFKIIPQIKRTTL